MWQLILNGLFLGIALTMDAFSVSIADGLNEPNMKRRKALMIASTFALFQFAMPLIGWLCVHTVMERFMAFRYWIPWIALVLLSLIGGKMIYENFKKRIHPIEEQKPPMSLGYLALVVQGIATSIDALSVGFTIAEYTVYQALLTSTIIAVVTVLFCLFGLFFGKKISNKLSSYAELIGGVILIGIGLEIFISNMIELYG